MRDYLVFVRAGKSSLHPQMLAEDPQRNWDCYVNAWADDSATAASMGGVEYCRGGGINKFEAFADAMEGVLKGAAYRYVLMLDDDLRFEPGAVSRFFEVCAQHQLFLSQPAIAWGSHANHLVNIFNPLCLVRQTNFVEVMAPCFSDWALRELLPTFRLTRCTWGIDYAWSALLLGQGLITVVDQITMAHTKPMDRSGGPFYEMLRRQGIEPEEELREVHRRYPRVGDFATLPGGHVYRYGLAEPLNARLVAWVEQRKAGFHANCGGTIVPVRPVEVGPPPGPTLQVGSEGNDGSLGLRGAQPQVTYNLNKGAP
ncbi:MAG: hypothetical protein JWQ88_2986 [Rhodoferax sp.]|nr:hypothetical protein [Rhodoferax sp.]